MESHQSKTGAGDETRTRDINLGKVALYQLSYTRACEPKKIAARLQTSMRELPAGSAARHPAQCCQERLKVFRDKRPVLAERASRLWVRRRSRGQPLDSPVARR
jgi:hypothetical protein